MAIKPGTDRVRRIWDRHAPATTGTCGSGNAPSGSPPTTRPGGPLPLREQAGFVITCNERSNAGTVERLRAVKPTNPAHPKT